MVSKSGGPPVLRSMATSFSALLTALFATVYVVAVAGVCLFGLDWAFVALMDLPSAVAMGLYGLTGVAVAAIAVWFGRLAWRAEQALGPAGAPRETGAGAGQSRLA